mmetsp:Transcript_15247/g.25405  ORF Transcript_15247/g.25405 Transcript_15247/m.25405 type:complete len:155 (-) Transcript_15247:1213-1677(-)
MNDMVINGDGESPNSRSSDAILLEIRIAVRETNPLSTLSMLTDKKEAEMLMWKRQAEEAIAREAIVREETKSREEATAQFFSQQLAKVAEEVIARVAKVQEEATAQVARVAEEVNSWRVEAEKAQEASSMLLARLEQQEAGGNGMTGDIEKGTS